MNQKEIRNTLILTCSLTIILTLVSFFSIEELSISSLPLYFFMSATFLIFTGACIFLFLDSFKWEEEKSRTREREYLIDELNRDLNRIRSQFNEVIKQLKDDHRELKNQIEALNNQTKEIKKITEINGQNQVHQFFEV